ncbi:permease prefix domain 1-containing protein [Saccharothrix luteola]|uniref:permease prefix domain 1-containing protein n=1 Tax=Saccharothrix luteola TaxID=2893018 RepID=UPI001E56B4A5|nr:permease prefix domain 1-containing protein [Saccharothrix luteola]MCC8246206.1 permease prefix domain 1-containing protein [Saccharothrix luteola]
MSTAQLVDPVEDYLEELAASLHGPARAKAAMLREVRDGLVDAVEAQTRCGVPHAQAARRAVRDFGAADEVAPEFQRELTIAQTRRTARVAAVTVPVLVVCQLLVHAAAGDWRLGALAVHLAALATAAGLLAVTALVATGPLTRMLPTPHRLPLAVAWTASAAAVGMALAAVALGVTSALSTDWPLTAFAGVLATAAHGVVATSARECRRCAQAVEGVR